MPRREASPNLPAMEFHQLRSFVAVATEGSLSKAAERLFSSPPAVSAHIKALEDEFGFPLFDRTPRGMVLTENGRRLHDRCGGLLDARTELLHTAASLRDKTAGVLRLGLINEPGDLQMDRILQRVLVSHPGMRFEFEHGRSFAILDNILSRSLDAGFFLGEPDDTRLAHWRVGEVGLCIAGPAAWAASLPPGNFEALQSRPWVFTSPKCGYYSVLRRLADDHGLRLDGRFLSDEGNTALHFAAGGLAMTVVRESQARPLAREGKVFIWEGWRLDQPVCFGFLRERAAEPALRTLVSTVEAVLGPASAGPARSTPRRRSSRSPSRKSR